MLCYVVLCYVVLCCVMLCYVVLCCVALRCVKLRRVTSRYVTSRHVTSYHIIYYIMSCCIILYYITLHYTISYYIMLYHVISCYIMLCRVVLYYIILYYIILYYIIKVTRSRYRPGVAQRVGRGIALLFNDRGTRRWWVVSSTPRPHFTPEKTRYLLYRRLGGPQGPSWLAENLVPTWFRSQTFQPVSVSIPTELSGPPSSVGVKESVQL